MFLTTLNEVIAFAAKHGTYIDALHVQLLLLSDPRPPFCKYQIHMGL